MQDLEQLKLLSIFHYVVAGMAALFSMFPLFHLFFGIHMLGGMNAPADEEEMVRFMGCFFISFAGLFILGGLTFAVCLAVAGRFLSQQRRYTFCLVMAAVACMFMPFGTVLGVFTIIVLLRESVKELFEAASPEAAAAGPGLE